MYGGEELKIKKSITKIEQEKLNDVYKRRILDENVKTMRGGKVNLMEEEDKENRRNKPMFNREDIIKKVVSLKEGSSLKRTKSGKFEDKRVCFQEDKNEYFLSQSLNKKELKSKEEKDATK